MSGGPPLSGREAPHDRVGVERHRRAVLVHRPLGELADVMADDRVGLHPEDPKRLLVDVDDRAVGREVHETGGHRLEDTPRQRLALVQRGHGAAPLGDVGERAEHMIDVAVRVEVRVRVDHQPDAVADGRARDPHHDVLDGPLRSNRRRHRMLGARERRAVLADHVPIRVERRCADQLVVAETKQRPCRLVRDEDLRVWSLDQNSDLEAVEDRLELREPVPQRRGVVVPRQQCIEIAFQAVPSNREFVDLVRASE